MARKMPKQLFCDRATDVGRALGGFTFVAFFVASVQPRLTYLFWPGRKQFHDRHHSPWHTVALFALGMSAAPENQLVENKLDID